MTPVYSYHRFRFGLRAVLLLCGAGFLLAASPDARAQTYPNSPVFRDYRPPKDDNPARDDGLRRQIDVFMLERDAAKGDPLAQHELGVRYLLGRGVKTDTALSALWLQRAAAQGLTPAMYNYALLLSNGWGVDWNPFEAYRYFLRAAEEGMTEAEYMVGIFHTDGLVMKQDWQKAYDWISRAAEAGYKPAKRAQEEIIRRGHVHPRPEHAPAASASPETASPDTASEGVASVKTAGADTTSGKRSATTRVAGQDGGQQSRSDAEDAIAQDAGAPDVSTPGNGTSPAGNASAGSQSSGWKPIFLDFEADTTQKRIPTEQILGAYLGSAAFSAQDSAMAATLIEDAPADSALLRLRRMAEVGNPEALELRGRLREEGRSLPADRIAAAADYASAVYLESMRAPRLLLQLLRQDGFAVKLSRAAWGGDADAQYVWAVLRALEFDMRLTESMARDMLQRSAEAGNTRAIVQLGIWQSAGRWGERDMAGAESFWRMAARMHDREARVRLAAAAVLGTGSTLRIDEAMPILENAANLGSLVAEVALAYSYQRGIGRTMRKGEAVRLYRDAAYRGSGSAYRALRAMHDARRPADAIFRLDED